MKPPSQVQMQRELRRLRAKLTPDERLAKSEDMAKKLQQYDDLVGNHKAQKSAMRELEKAREVEIREIAKDVRLGSEVRDVGCRWVADFARKRVELVRLDTMETISSRSMTDADRQLAIELRLNEDDLDEIPLERPTAVDPDAEANADSDSDGDDLPDEQE